MEIYTPTQREILRQCLEIQELWNEKEEWKRAGLREPQQWLPPGVIRTMRSQRLPSSLSEDD